MPRTARIAPKENIYHVLTRGNNRQLVFGDDDDFNRYLDLLSHYREKYRFKLYHYVLMTNHVHLILEPSEKGGDLSEIMKGINLSYALHYKRKHNHTGHFWQDRYKSILISKDQYLLTCGSYVELNPVRAKIVVDPKDYPWSSYPVYAHGKRDPLIETHPVYDLLSLESKDRQKKYREFIRGMIRDQEAMKGEMDRRVVYGGEDFLKKVSRVSQIGEKQKPVGRPRGRRKNKENRPD